MKTQSESHKQSFLRASVTEFGVPPIHDALVLGKSSPIGCVAMRKATELLVVHSFEHIKIEDDDVVSDVLVRAAILRRIPRDRLISFVLERIKPLMGEEEILHLDLEAKVVVEDEL